MPVPEEHEQWVCACKVETYGSVVRSSGGGHRLVDRDSLGHDGTGGVVADTVLDVRLVGVVVEEGAGAVETTDGIIAAEE